MMKEKKPRRKVKRVFETPVIDEELTPSIFDTSTQQNIVVPSLSLNAYSNITTFEDLYNFLQTYDGCILEWLNVSWEGKDKQESLLRLFAGLGLITKLSEYHVCKGNFNLQTITNHTSLNDIFYDEKNKLRNLKDKGDSSDLTCISKKNDKHILTTTSKNLNKMNINKLDIDKILTNFKKYEDFTMSLCICIRNTDDFIKMKKSTEITNTTLKSYIEKEDTIIIDWNDLKQAFEQFKLHFKDREISTILKRNKTLLCFKLHQQLAIYKTMQMKSNSVKKILWGQIQRSGKSYIIAGSIIEDSKIKSACNYLVITTAPNETIEQQRIVFDCLQLEEFNIVILDGKNKKPILKEKNIIICSKQFLQTKIDNREGEEKPRSIAWLKKLNFDIRFIDESHNGGTTQLAKKTLDFYGKNTFTIQITATYSKPINDFNIPKENWILWDLEDIKLCKNITKKESLDRLVYKHGDYIREIITKYSYDNIINEYSKYPEISLLTHKIKEEIVSEIIKETEHNNYGWSTESCFLLEQGVEKDKECKNQIIYKEKFQNENETLKMWYSIFGKKGKYGIPDKNYPDESVFMKRIENICKNSITHSRFIGEGEFSNEPMIIMCFLPQNNIDKISRATIQLLEKEKILPDYEILSINSKTTNDPKTSIEEMRIIARNNGKKGVLVLSGRQCSLGVSIDNCDIVILLNNSMSYDMIYQMMFRSMTEAKNKKYGFVIDLNIHRVVSTTLINYASLIKPDEHPRDAVKYILQEKLINLNADHWMQCFGNDDTKINQLCEHVYQIYSSNFENAIKSLLERLHFKEILLTKEEQSLFNAIFKYIKPTKEQKELLDKLFEDCDEIKKGIEKTEIVDSSSTTSTTSTTSTEKEESKINYMDILKHIIPLVCLLTIHNTETSFIEMYNLIESNTNMYEILIDQTKTWWGKSVDSRIIKKFIQIYIKYMKDEKETNQIIRTIKELFTKNLTNQKELSILIDKYLIPQELEKKTNAEVSTPLKLRKEMLDKIPSDFWKIPNTVLEPCSGKGGFIIDIIDRFMDGLKHIYSNEKSRYKFIVEHCIYFSDINPTNIFICKLLIDPYNEYDLNYNEGNTLELDIKTKWGIDGFDAVIGNPPYNSSGYTATGNTIWQDFTKKSINKWLRPKGYLLFVHPPGWRKPNTERGKFTKMFDLMTTQNQMLYLEIHGIKDGQKVFNCGTRYDWYLIEKTNQYKNTIIVDENGKQNEINLSELSWLPNSNILEINKILAKKDDERCPIIQSMSAYEPRKKWMSSTETQEFKYPCVHSTPKSGIRYMYSKVNDRGHFGVSKVIFGDSGIYKPLIDMKGEYGMTQHSMAIQVDNLEEATYISKVIESDKFDKIIQSCLYSSYAIDWNIFKEFKKDFWKEFI